MKLKQAIDSYLDYCEYLKKLSRKSIKAYAIDLEQLRKHLSSEDIPAKSDISAYIVHLHKICSPKTVKRKIASIRAFFNYLEFEDILTDNPVKKIKTKFREPQVLPKTIQLENIEKILRIAYQELEQAQTSYAVNTAMRDAAIIEMLFATGMRISELCSLVTDCIDLNNGNVRIMGKGSKERVLQIGNQDTLSFLRRYAEKNSVEIEKSGYFFVNRLGARVSDQSVRFLINRICVKAGIEKHITPHMFRHSFATLLLEEDVDIRYIQRMLGHSSIQTTQIYTQVSTEKQRQILTEKNPRNKIGVKVGV
jgi:integrase/recombinase XerD